MYRFAFDLGSGSLGWAIFKLRQDESTPGERPVPVSLADLGVRVFPTGRDPESKTSNASARRQPRQMRRQGKRRKMRQKELERRLVRFGLMPQVTDRKARETFFRINPLMARARAAGLMMELTDEEPSGEERARVTRG